MNGKPKSRTLKVDYLARVEGVGRPGEEAEGAHPAGPDDER